MALARGIHRGFTDDEVRFIRETYADHRLSKSYWGEERLTMKRLAEMYGVTTAAISHMIKRRTYRHIP